MAQLMKFVISENRVFCAVELHVQINVKGHVDQIIHVVIYGKINMKSIQYEQ